MRVTPTALDGVLVVDPDRVEDERGFFARTYCSDELATYGIAFAIAQSSVSFNHRRGTLRGLHWQTDPAPEAKLVRCTRGAVFDVAVDLRPDSPSYRSWVGVELTADNGRQLYIPAHCAHGFQTLVDGAEVSYQISTAYRPELARGARWDDPAFGIQWPLPPSVMSDRDRTHAPFTGRP
jgi:dTDP-4-dehydrorhamnose 3,5-epimerase